MHMTPTLIARFDKINRVSEVIQDYDDEGLIEAAQMNLEFDEGIKVANEVVAEFLADLHHLMDFHGQDFDAIVAAGAAKYETHKEEASSV